MNQPESKIETEKLYFQDAYLQEFTARVLAREIREGFPVVVLDRTAFYPESGGQPHDLGWLNEVRVIRVEEENGLILHFLETELAGLEVRGRIDWPRRFDHMQQHTGQHILSQAFYELTRGETLSFHLGQEESTVEIGLPAIKDETLTRVEELANRVVFSDLEVKTYFLPEDELSSIPLRKPPKKAGLIRVVEVNGFDYSACGGTHCRRTGEVGLIKILKQEKIRGNVRFSFVCGFRAWQEFENRRHWLQQAARLFSAEEAEVPACAEKSLAELKSLKKKQKKLEERLSFFEAREILSRSSSKIISGLYPDRSPEEIKFLALNLVHQAELLVVLAAHRDQYFHLVLAASAGLKVDVREVISVLQPEIEFKGGGSPTLVELVSPEKDKAEKAVKLAVEFFEGRKGLS
ncbi:MAG: alanyl-tRNA editing protein [Candidatus Saccharicenans sp.]|nr:alanyl-tRNA editing protein [Candidatus Saccharicenans sp.]MDH7493403.1 alanyl-tRNA editing protein [Candidatus Saccharicenans sp.]